MDKNNFTSIFMSTACKRLFQQAKDVKEKLLSKQTKDKKYDNNFHANFIPTLILPM